MAPITKSSLTNIPLSYATVSIGRSGKQTLKQKLQAISHANFQAIELGFPDLVIFASTHHNKKISNNDYEDLSTAAKEVARLCKDLNLEILMLQPFTNFEGWPPASEQRGEAFIRAKGWMQVMEACGCSMLQVGSSDTPTSEIGNDRERFVNDLRELADLLATKGMRIAYENWCWSSHAPNWEDVWEICRSVDRGNFGLCLDTFQSAGGEWGDPTTSSGLIESRGRNREDVEKAWKESCARLAETVPAEKIFLLQISDAYKVDPPLSAEDIDGMRPRARWSGSYRPLPFEGYLPVVDFTKAVLRTGFRGYFSYEIFDAGSNGKGREGADDLEAGAQAGRRCQERLVGACVEE